MKNKLYKQVDKYILDRLKEGDKKCAKRSYKHFERTAYWVKKLKPNTDEALLIAAIGHDAERIFREKVLYGKGESVIATDKIKYHQEKGAEIVCKFLEDCLADKGIVSKVYELISKHEVGGTEEQNILMDADSISFLENNVDHFLNKKVQEQGKQNIREKFDWMYNRISSDSAKEIAKPYYEDAIKRLNKI
ncbi:DUF4202 family protein [bacterium]|jgi:hypothetical protein|nr:DUF4202 family protein [bacterium]MBT4121928.1 DUF4202 family protein [bacterium]MBT4335525.1 DUF4202 family protein [bacterium]MBT4495420.1 DUF4202 family protein [bacterium]MBT4763645.1 DUF4202 family protein [bacterium]